MATGAVKATIVAIPPVPDGAESMTVGFAPAVATDAGAAVVVGPLTATVVLDSFGTALATVVVVGAAVVGAVSAMVVVGEIVVGAAVVDTA